jgi:RecB family exonuclease
VERARRAGRLRALDAIVDWPGHLRRLRRRFADWTRAERSWRDAAAAFDDETNTLEREERALYEEYRALLADLGAEDEAGLAVWASKRLTADPPPSFRRMTQLTLPAFDPAGRAAWRLLDHGLRVADSVRVTLPYRPEASWAALYEPVAPIRERLLALGFRETVIAEDLWRPAGLRALESTLFREETELSEGGPEPISVTDGLAIRGAPQGDGEARVVAREVRRLLRRGVEPEQIVVLFRRWSDQADLVAETLRDWGIPVWADAPRDLESDPAVAALGRAARIPIDDWPTDSLVQLLRNGQMNPDWPGADPWSLAVAAAGVVATRVFRGRDLLLRALDRAVARSDDRQNDRQQRDRANVTRELVGRLLETLRAVDRPGTWAEQVDRLFELAHRLGIGREFSAGLDWLRDALDDHGDILEQFVESESEDGSPRRWRWPDFVREFEGVIAETSLCPSPPAGSAFVRLSELDDADGIRADHVLLADLTEGTFPAREAVEPYLALRPGQQPGAPARLAFAREMLRFIRTIGMARSGVVLLHPTTDVKGQELLRAGFLDDLLAALSPSAKASGLESHPRLRPTLIDQPELAGSASDRRILTVAMAVERGDLDGLSRFAARSSHRRALEGTAAALGVLRRRGRETPYSEFDGRLVDGSAILRIADTFGPGYRFSASQLETYLSCPFKFFAQYVLEMTPRNDRDELTEDFTERGSRIHDILEEVERAVQTSDGLPREEQAIRAIDKLLDLDPDRLSEVDLGLLAIERGQLQRTLNRYQLQIRRYEAESPAQPVPHRFEAKFGQEGSDHGPLELGPGDRGIRLQGKIDRIDLVETSEGHRFRIIDYKSSKGPAANEVHEALMLQLPLYAMAVERIILASEEIRLLDVGYWALKFKGYQPINFPDWGIDQARIEEFVFAVVEKLRQGIFNVRPRKSGCESYCDYRAICRVRQVRAARKPAGEAMVPEIRLSSARAKSGRATKRQRKERLS